MNAASDEPEVFDWDEAKAAANLAKHGVPFTWATRVFDDWARADFDVTQPAQGEKRRKAVGMIEGLLVTVVYTMRGDAVRLISARRANKKEAERYGQVHS